MADMTTRMKELFEKLPSVLLSTATPDGVPNCVPVGAKKILDDHTILISDQYMNKTLANIKANPRVAITFWEGHEGYQLKGTVAVETSGPPLRGNGRLDRGHGKQDWQPAEIQGRAHREHRRDLRRLPRSGRGQATRLTPAGDTCGPWA